MASTLSTKRRHEDNHPPRSSKKVKRFKRQREYHSSSEDEAEQQADFPAINLQDSDIESQEGDHEQQEDGGSSSDSNSSSSLEDASTTASKPPRSKSKRNDPAAFSNSMSKILSTKLPTSLRADPVLSRSKTVSDTASALAAESLERKAKAKIRLDRKKDLEKGRVRDVLGLESGEAGETAELEKRLRKVAQRGVVKLFNAVRAAQVKGEEAGREKGLVGMGKREERANEVSKQSFLELINGKVKGRSGRIEEA